MFRPKKSIASRLVLASLAGGLLFGSGAGDMGRAWGQQDPMDSHDKLRQQSGAKVTIIQEERRQDVGKSDAEMVDDAFQAKGMELGQFLLLPKIEVGEQYNSNVFAQKWNPQFDTVTVVRPEVKLRSRFVEHALNFGMFAEDYRYSRFSGDDRTDFTSYVDGRYDFSSDTVLNQYSQVSFGHEDRTSPDAVNGTSPGKTFSSTNRTSLEHKGARFKLLGELGYDRKEFGSVTASSGTTINAGDRDRWEYLARQRASYEMFPGYSALVEVSENIHDFDSTSDRNGYNRSSSGYRVETGFAVDISKLIRGDFLLGYMQQNYQDSRFKDPKGLAMRAAFNWTPTKMTTVMPALERSVTDTTTAQVSGITHNMASLTVKHEFARNMIYTGFGSASYDQNVGLNGQDYWTYEVGNILTYAFMPELYVSGEVKYKNKDSELTTSSFSQTIMMVRLGLQY